MRFVLYFLFISSLCFSQKGDSILIEKKIKSILILKSQGKFEKASVKIDSFYNNINTVTTNDFLKGRVVFTKGRVEVELGEYDKAILSAEKALYFYKRSNHKLEKANALNLKGVAYYHKSNLDSTLYYYNKSFELKKENNSDGEQLAISLYNTAIVYEDLGKFDEAIATYKKAANYLAKLKNISFLPDTYLGIANTYKLKRDQENTQLYIRKAFNSALLRYDKESPDITFFYISYADVLMKNKKYLEAKEMLEKTKEIRLKTYGKYHRWTCEAYLKLGEVAYLNNNFKTAKTLLKETILIGEKLNNTIYAIHAKKQLATLYLEENKNLKEATKLTIEAIDALKLIYGEQHEDIAASYLILAKLNTTKSEKYLKLLYESTNYNPQNLATIIAPFEILNALEYELNLNSEKYYKTNQISLLEKQYLLINNKIALMEEIYKEYASDISKIFFANTTKKSVEKGINICWQLYRKTNENNYKLKALEFSDFYRNSVLLTGVKKKNFKKKNISETYLVKENKIAEEINKVLLAIYLEESKNKPSLKLLNSFYTKRIKLKEQKDSLQQVIKDVFPEYKKHTLQLKNIEITEVKNRLKEDEQLITYFIGENSSFFFSIDKATIKFEKIKNSKELVVEIKELQEAIITQKETKEISKKVFNGITNDKSIFNKENLIFITDDVLSYIPFEILLNSKNEYLVENYNISYTGSLGLFLEQNKQKEKKKYDENWIGFSPEYSKDLTIKKSLEEVDKIAEITNGVSFIGKKSTKANFVKNAAKAKILHLAMHTKISNKKPEFNKLLFYDEALTSSEIYLTDIDAELLVLSACETGYGKIEKGEGVMNLSRAFTYAGTSSIIMSLWKVPDKETQILMTLFYEFLKKGNTKNVALKKAKKEYLNKVEDQTLKHPYYWAGFVINGNNEAILFKANNNFYIFCIGVFLFLACLSFLFKNKLVHFFK